MNDGISHPERSSDGTEGVASAEKGIISNIIKRLRSVTIKQLSIQQLILLYLFRESIVSGNYSKDAN